MRVWRPTPNCCAGLELETGMKPVDALHRRLRRLRAVLNDPSVTEHERANAEALKTRLEAKLTRDGIPQGDWTDVLFRLGRTVQEMKKTTTPPPSSSGASKIGFRFGRTFREGLKKWRSS